MIVVGQKGTAEEKLLVRWEDLHKEISAFVFQHIKIITILWVVFLLSSFIIFIGYGCLHSSVYLLIFEQVLFLTMYNNEPKTVEKNS